jgi:hypothetical protein
MEVGERIVAIEVGPLAEQTNRLGVVTARMGFTAASGEISGGDRRFVDRPRLARGSVLAVALRRVRRRR